MNNFIKGILAAMMVGLSFQVSAQDADAGAVEPTEAVEAASNEMEGLGEFVDTWVKSQMQAHDVPSGTVSIVKDGEIIFSKGYGFADLEKRIPVDPAKTMFRPGSVSKLFTWTAVMQQVEEGNLDLDADVNEYLKDFQIPATYAEPITLRHILAHTAGFEEGGLGYLILTDPEKITSLKEAMTNHIPARINKPGAYSSYSNYATALAGHIVANVSGLSFEDYIEQRILAPLGMYQSTFKEPLPEQLADDMAIGYKRANGVNVTHPFEIISNFGPAGAMSASANDMAKFMMAHLNDGTLGDSQILKPETAQQMHSLLFTPDERIAGMAHGFFVNNVNGHRIIEHGGDTQQFHSMLSLNKQENLGIYASFVGDGGVKARGSLQQAVYDWLFPQEVEPVTPPADFGDRAAKYAGTYKFWRHNQSTIEKAGGLSGGIGIAPTADNTLLVTGFGQPRQFVEIDEHLFRQVDGTQIIAFGEDADGNINDLYLDGLVAMSASRAPGAESALFAQVLPALSLIIFVTVLIGWCYRRKEFKAMVGGEKTAIRLSIATAVTNLLFLVLLLVVLVSEGTGLFAEIPTSLRLVLILPNIAVLLSISVIWFAVKAWREGYWHTGRKVHYTLVALAALFVSWFYYYWNFLGLQLPV